jgi:hypothetical protein
MRFKPLTYLLIAIIFFAACIFDWYRLGNVVIWDIFVSLTLIFSILTIFYGIRFIKNKERTGLLFVYDLMAIIVGALILIVTAFFEFFFILLSIDGLSRD